MEKICEYLIYSNNTKILNDKNNITYYIRLSPADLISCDISNNVDIINYMSEILHKYFYNYDYEILFDYQIPMITFKFHLITFMIKFKKRFDGRLYWILML